MTGWVIVYDDEGMRMLGWDWGTEFHYDRVEARARAKELEEITDCKFKVVKAELKFKGEKNE